MSSDLYTTATQLAVLQAGRGVVWETQDDAGSTAPPSAADSGVYLQNAVRALVHVSLREQPHRRSARLTIPVVDLTANGTVNQIVVASVTGNDTVVLRGIGEADYSVDFTESDSATLAVLADPCRAEMRLWWSMAARPGSSAPGQPWAWEGTMVPIDRRGRVMRLDTAGLDRLHVQLSDRLGDPGDGSIVTLATPSINIAPALSEVT